MHSDPDRTIQNSTRRVLASPFAYAIALAIFVGVAVIAQSPVPVWGPESIRLEELRTKVFHLSSDEFRGRGDGTPELDAAANYIAEVFEESGLTPVGDDGYFQEFQVERLSLGNDNHFEVTGTSGDRLVELNAPNDFVPFPGSIDGEVSGPMTFLGYGVRAPGLGYDDLAEVALEGTIAVVLDGVPRGNDPNSRFNALTDRDLSSISSKALDAEQAGAIGLVIVQGPLHGATTSVRALETTLRPNLPPRRSVMRRAAGAGDPTIPIAVVARSAAERIVPDLAAVQAMIDEQLEPETISLEGVATLRVDFDRDAYTARNVIARIEGSDPTLREEVIIVGAHYDHDGADNGLIWNGADDNASGTSALLELAEAFSGGPRPGRSILLSAWAAEEKGMLGSQNYVRHPVVALEQTVAMFQLDMIGRNEEHPPNASEGFERERASENGDMINVIGSVFSPDFREVVERANSGVGLELRFRYDYGAQDLIRRSDHWSFLSERIPALFLFGGLHPDYHTPNDTAEKINYRKLERVVELTYLALLDLGDRPTGPRFTIPIR
jgi:hypothetical protein